MMPRWVLTEESPPTPGWWPVTLCWDSREGLFPSAGFWTGTRWEDGLSKDLDHVIAYWSEPSKTKLSAELTAYLNDMEMPR